MRPIEKVAFIYDQIRLVNDEPRDRPGLAAAKIDATFDTLGLVPSAFLHELFAWRNGIEHLNSFLQFLSLEECVEQYRTYAQIARDDSDFRWKSEWFPVLDMNGDFQYCIDIPTGFVTVVDLENGTARMLSGHFERYLDLYVDAFRRGLCKFSGVSGSFRIDRDAWKRLAQMHGLRDSD